MTTISIDLPDTLLATLRQSPDDLGREMRLTSAALWYSQGRLSQEMAARLAGLDLTDFLLALRRLGIDSFTVDFQELGRESCGE